MNGLCDSLLADLGVTKLNETQNRMLNPLVLAYIGDAVHEMMVRTYVINQYSGSVNKLNQRVVAMIKATAQAEAFRQMESELTEEEIGMVKRGRNTKSLTVPKNTSVAEYRLATGFEALLGWLYLNGQEERLKDIVARAIRIAEKTGKEPVKGTTKSSNNQ